MASSSPKDHLYDLLKDFNTAMLVTSTADGTLHSRPMNVAELTKDASTHFATSLDSPKIVEIEKRPDVLVTFQSSSEYVVIKGTAKIVRDRALIDKLWVDAWKIWFPGGKDDPTLCLIRVDATDAEYWDNSGSEGLRYVFESLKALVNKTKPRVTDKVNAKVNI